MIKKTKKLKGTESLIENLKEIEYLDPKNVYIQIQTRRTKSYKLNVEEGDHVKKHQVIGVRDCGFYKQNIFSPVSGEVGKIEKRYTNMGKITACLAVKNDFKEEEDSRVKNLSIEELDKLDKDAIIKAVEDNAVSGMGGAEFPTHIKLLTKDKIDTVVLNGVECEPGIVSDKLLLTNHPYHVLKGLELAMKAVSAKKGIVCIKAIKKHAIESINAEIKKSFANLDIKVVELENYYPQGWEVEEIKKALQIDIQGKLPSTEGLVSMNVTTAEAIYFACRYNYPHDVRQVTVTGEMIKTPSVITAKIGTPIEELVELAGGYVNDEQVVMVMGGPMMGICNLLPNAVTTKTVTAIICLANKEIKEENCVRCSSCVKSCPAGLRPVQIMNAFKAGNQEALIKLDANKCVECGLCAYVCTSHINVTQYVIKGKNLIKK